MKKIKKYIMIGSFVVLAFIQLAAPLSRIIEQEEIVEEGTLYKFETRPIDPYDPFRGKYIRLSFENTKLNVKHPELWENEKEGYFPVLINEKGFAYVNEPLLVPPEEGDYLIMKVNNYYYSDSSIYYNYPFDRFYMNENEALNAEQAYRIANGDRTKSNAFALVKIKEGKAVLEDVIIGGISAKELQ